jgi:hypothetical protein
MQKTDIMRKAQESADPKHFKTVLIVQATDNFYKISFDMFLK